MSHRFLLVTILLGLTIGTAAGVGGFTFFYARGASYLTNNPAACANCHVMQDHYRAWQRGSHHAVAVCNDCHTPHDLVGKYTTKGLNGWHHSLAFTTQRFHEPIQIHQRNLDITEKACRRCHQDIVQMIDTEHRGPEPRPYGGEKFSCVRCHASVGHLE